MANERPPLSADLLAQAASIEPGVCFGLTPGNRIGERMPSETGQSIVTWRGKHDTPYKSTIATLPDESHNYGVPV